MGKAILYGALLLLVLVAFCFMVARDASNGGVWATSHDLNSQTPAHSSFLVVMDFVALFAGIATAVYIGLCLHALDHNTSAVDPKGLPWAAIAYVLLLVYMLTPAIRPIFYGAIAAV